MLFPELTRFSDYALLLVRLMVAIVFASSGWSHLKNSAARAKSIGMSKRLTIFLGVAELLGSLGLILGVLTQIAALGLILIMLGATYKKIFEWHTGFWGKDGHGWHYDLIFVVMNLVLVVMGGGRFILLN